MSIKINNESGTIAVKRQEGQKELERLENEINTELGLSDTGVETKPNDGTEPQTEPNATAKDEQPSDPDSAPEKDVPSDEESKPKPEDQLDGEGKKVEDDPENEEVRSEKGKRRVQELANAKRLAEERAAKLEAELIALKSRNKPESGQAPKTGGLPWETAPTEETETPKGLSPEELSEFLDERDQSKEIVSEIQNDTTYVKETYPELDETSDDYDEALANKVTEWFNNAFEKQHQLRQKGLSYTYPKLKDFVTDVMDIREKGKAAGKSEVSAKVAKQAATQPVTGTVSSSKGKSIEDTIKKVKTREELDALEAEVNAQVS